MEVVPRVVYDSREQDKMQPLVAVDMPAEQFTRKVDKTGLISFKANKYSPNLITGHKPR